eukprot:406829_1
MFSKASRDAVTHGRPTFHRCNNIGLLAAAVHQGLRDVFTKNALGSAHGSTVAIITASAYERTGKILQEVQSSGLILTNLKMTQLGREQAEKFCAGETEAGGITAGDLSSQPVVVMKLVADEAVSKWNSLCASKKRVLDGVIGSRSQERATKEAEFFFGPNNSAPSSAQFNNCTACVIKPHAVSKGLSGRIIDSILSEGFEISAIQFFTMDRSGAEEFLEVYKGVVPEYHAMVEEMVSGGCIAMEIRAESAVAKFRDLCGPFDAEIARHIFPQSLRARFGVDRVRNAVHCTDLAEDGELESRYFFEILQPN